MKRKTMTAEILLLLVACLWGSTFVVVKNAVEILPPFTFNAIRFTIAAILLLIVILLFYRNLLSTINRNLLLKGGFIGIFLFGGYALQTFGLLYTSASKAGFITGLSVVMVPLLAILFLKETIRRQAVIGITLATFGLFLLSINDNLSISFGDFLVFLCAICYALHIIFVGKWAPGCHPLLLAFIQIAAAGLLNFVFALFFEDVMRINGELLVVPEVLGGLVITAVFATALAFLIQTAAQKYTTPTKTALIFATEPVFAAIAGYWFANEILISREWIGCALILLGMVIAEMPTRTEKLVNASLVDRNMQKLSNNHKHTQE